MKQELSESVFLDEEAQNLFGIAENLSSPEKRLLYAICERSVRDLFSSFSEERDSAIEWLKDSEGNDPFSFPWICEILDLNREALLEKIWSLQKIGMKYQNASRELYAIIDLNNSTDQEYKKVA
ncbi:MAG: hypothetical protein GYA55_13755 [SAR324 cluster bacterium]|uniref:Uncharacterized protein n=1 Tax=SAR324 cluster bacterium TaxID=2024889 RepID=A0A7X9FUV8_9DELT|nr:hypothetical protein [SAR324 cluster bacterium]